MLLPDLESGRNHFTVKALVNAYEGLFGKAPVVDKWTFSTNGVSIMGRHGIPVMALARVKNLKRMHLTKKPGNLTW